MFVVTYVYGADSGPTQDTHTAAHVAFLDDLHRAGTAHLCGPFHPGRITGGMIVLSAPDEAAVTAMLDRDPFWTAGVIVQRDITPFEVVIGGLAA